MMICQSPRLLHWYLNWNHMMGQRMKHQPTLQAIVRPVEQRRKSPFLFSMHSSTSRGEQREWETVPKPASRLLFIFIYSIFILKSFVRCALHCLTFFTKLQTSHFHCLASRYACSKSAYTTFWQMHNKSVDNEDGKSIVCEQILLWYPK